MPSIFEFMENPEIFPYESTLSDNTDVLHALIDYISVNPNQLLFNEQECYTYPAKAAQILSVATTYRVLIVKRHRKNPKTDEDQSYYPHLDRLFKNLRADAKLQESLLGYLNKVLVSLAKKTPEIYEFFKENQQLMTELLKDNRIVRSFQQFWITFLVESTMSLYVFLKNIVLRGLMFRIIDQKDIDNLAVYELIGSIYEEISKKLESKFLPEDQREELEEIAQSFHDQDFVTLLILKISAQRPEKTLWIGKLILSLLKNSPKRLDIAHSMAKNHIQAYQDYFEGYQESSGFMDFLLQDQLEILKVLVLLSQYGVLEDEHEANLLKRLLVYSSIHRKNSLLHNLLLKMITILAENARIQPFKEINVIPFLMKNAQTKMGKYAYGSLIWRVCEIWHSHQSQLSQLTDSLQRQFISEQLAKKSSKLVGLTLYKALPLPTASKDPLQESNEDIHKEQKADSSGQKPYESPENITKEQEVQQK